MSEATVTLTSSDQEVFTISMKAALTSGLIKETFQLGEEEDDDDDDEKKDGTEKKYDMPVPRVDGPTLKKIVDFLVHYEQNPFAKIDERLPALPFNEIVPGEYYTQYMKDLEGDCKQEAMDVFYSVRAAADYMDIAPLVEMMCLWVAFKMETFRTQKEMFEYLRMPMFSEEEKPQARRDYPFLFQVEEEETN